MWARAKVAPEGNLLHLRHLERGKQILRQSKAALRVQFSPTGKTDSAAKQHNTIVYDFLRTGKTDSAEDPPKKICMYSFLKMGKEIL